MFVIISFFQWKIVRYQSRHLNFKYLKQNMRLRKKGIRYQWYTEWGGFLKLKSWRLIKPTFWVEDWVSKRKYSKIIKIVKLEKCVRKILTRPSLKLRWKLTQKKHNNIYFLSEFTKIKVLQLIFLIENYWCADTIWTIPFDINDIFICALYYLFFYKDGLTGIELIAYGYIIEYVDFFHLTT